MATDLSGATLVVAACANDIAAAELADRRARPASLNVIDKPEFCDFSFGAIVNRSPLVIGISTDGAAPVFAQTIRTKLEAILRSDLRAGRKPPPLAPAGKRLD